MRVFVTGAAGWIGSAVVPELLGAGHTVVGLARNDANAAALEAAGAQVHRGDIQDPDSLRAGAAQADAVIHLAYVHDFTRMEEAAAIDRAAIDALVTELEGSDRPLAIASGVVGLGNGRPGTEEDRPDPGSHPRVASAQAVLDAADRGVRSVVVRLAPTVHGEGDAGFVPFVISVARRTGVSAYVGDGANRWPAVHRADAASVFRLGIESAPAGSVLHAIDDEGVPTREIAEVIGRHLDLPVEPRPPEHFDWMGLFWSADMPVVSARTRELLGWAPSRPGLIEDLESGHYFRGQEA